MEDQGDFTIDFGRSGNGDIYRRAGWSEPEPRHTWTLGAESTLEFPRPSRAGTYLLVLELGPFIWKDRLPAQHLAVVVNGREVAEFAVNEVASFECTVPWGLIEGHEWVSVTFRHPDAAKPVDVNGVPDHREIALAFETLSFLRRLDPVAEAPADDQKNPAEDLPLDQLVMQFESLGENCEFGLVQRRCGAEPLGLLRFASAPLPILLAGLAARFEGVGDPEQTEVRMSSNRQEFLVVDKRYGFNYHPWVLVGEAEPEEIRRREAKRLPLLRRKLIEDLEEGNKIFVYRGMRRLPQPLVLRLVTAIQAYGPSTLLWVELADSDHPTGMVEFLTEGLLKGYIDRFAPDENAHALSLDAWIAICRNARLLLQRMPRRTANTAG
jgi:hypothetical protein